MAGDRVQGGAAGELRAQVGEQAEHHLLPSPPGFDGPEDLPVGGGEQVGVAVRLASDHHPVGGSELGGDRAEIPHPAVQDDGQRGEVALEAVHPFVAQGRYVAVLGGTQAPEPRHPGVDDEGVAAGAGDHAHELVQVGVALAPVDADAGLDRHRQSAGAAHRPHAFPHEPRLGHQAGAETRFPDARARAADVDVHLVEAGLLGQARARRHPRRVRPADLQRHGTFGGVVGEQAFPVAVQQRPGAHHLGVEQGVAGDQPQQIALVAVGARHHRRDAQAAVEARRGRRGRDGGGHQPAGGAGAAAQGRSVSSCAARRSSRASPPKRAPICTPIGRPPGVWCRGRVAAGQPVTL